MTDNGQMRKEVDLLTLIGNDTDLRRVASTNGGEYAGACPWCGGRDRFRVWPKKERYWCRQCNRSGDAIQYLREFHELSFREACERIESNPLPRLRPGADRRLAGEQTQSHSPPPYSWQEKAWRITSTCEAALRDEGGTKARAYLREVRGLREKTVCKYRLGYSPSGRTFFGLWVPRGITIPCRVGDDLWCVRVRTPCNAPGKKYRHVKGGKAALFGLGNLGHHTSAFLCEGEFDAMLLDQEAGDLAGVIAFGGVSTQLGTWLPCLVGLRDLFLALDVDEAGRKRGRELLVSSRRMRPAWLPTLRGRVSDLTDYWREGGSLRDWAEYHLARESFRKHAVIQDEIVF